MVCHREQQQLIMVCHRKQQQLFHGWLNASMFFLAMLSVAAVWRQEAIKTALLLVSGEKYQPLSFPSRQYELFIASDGDFKDTGYSKNARSDLVTNKLAYAAWHGYDFRELYHVSPQNLSLLPHSSDSIVLGPCAYLTDLKRLAIHINTTTANGWILWVAQGSIFSDLSIPADHYVVSASKRGWDVMFIEEKTAPIASPVLWTRVSLLLKATALGLSHLEYVCSSADTVSGLYYSTLSTAGS